MSMRKIRAHKQPVERRSESARESKPLELTCSLARFWRGMHAALAAHFAAREDLADHCGPQLEGLAGTI